MYKKYIIVLFFFFSANNVIAMAHLPAEGKSLTVLELIEQYSEEYGVHLNLAVPLAKFESKFNPLAKNPKSSAKGVYQWIDSSWKGLCKGDVLDAEDNIKCAMKTISNGGITHWTSDLTIRTKLWDLGLLKCYDFKTNKCKLVWD